MTAWAIAAALGCTPAPRAAIDQEVTAAVQRYNEALPQAFARADASVLSSVATASEVRRVDDLIAFLAQGRMRMDARQERADVGRAEVDRDGRASIGVTEVWWYRHWIPSTGEVKQAPRRVRYRNRYELVRVDGRWVVDRLRETGYEELK